MLERLDLAYAVNVHVAQGVTAAHGILAMRSDERKLLSEQSFLVSLTRVADRATLVLDNGRKVERGVLRNPGDKTSALEVAERGRAEVIRGPETRSPIDMAIERYAKGFAEIERMREDDRTPWPEQERELAQARKALDRVQPNGAEDLQIVLDRHPELVRDLGAGGTGELRRAWADEGRVRADPAAYADRFVADWRAASAERADAGTWRDAERAERRMERLEERMAREPNLERTLDVRIPERQLQIGEPGRGGLNRDRDMDMSL